MTLDEISSYLDDIRALQGIVNDYPCVGKMLTQHGAFIKHRLWVEADLSDILANPGYFCTLYRLSTNLEGKINA